MEWFLIESDKVQLTWVEAESELGAKRIHATRYGDDQELTIERSADDISIHVELEGSKPPFRALQEEDDGTITMHEKRVNQAGSKGIYRLTYRP